MSKKCKKMLKNQGIRAISDLRNEKVGFKIREHTLQRIPYMLVVGDREVDEECVAVRSLGGEDLGFLAVDKFVELVKQ
jgi:threonyl-tRNA synthetase